MGFKRYRGEVVNVETAMLAHRVLVITCLECGRKTNRWAYRLNERSAAWGALLLNAPARGFYCQGCRRSVLVTVPANALIQSLTTERAVSDRMPAGGLL